MRVLLISLVLGTAVPAFAQQASLLEVDLGLVRDQIARDLSVDEAQIPARVAVPLDVAALACGMDPTALATEFRLDGQADCTAMSAGPELNRLVQRKISLWR